MPTMHYACISAHSHDWPHTMSCVIVRVGKGGQQHMSKWQNADADARWARGMCS